LFFGEAVGADDQRDLAARCRLDRESAVPSGSRPLLAACRSAHEHRGARDDGAGRIVDDARDGRERENDRRNHGRPPALLRGAPATPSVAGSVTPLSAAWRRSDGVSPNGTRQAIVPRLRSIATTCPYGGLRSGTPFMNSAFVLPCRE